MKIFLLGFPGSGKTTFGKRLSEELRYPFFDTDHLIENKTEMTVGEYFALYGEDMFRKAEQTILRTHFPENAVIAAGGGLPCFFDNMQRMNKLGKTVYLDTPLPILTERLIRGKHKRPMFKNLPDEELVAFIIERLEKRLPFYKQAQIQINPVGASIKSVIQRLQD